MTKQPLTKERALQIVKELYPDIDFYNSQDETDGLQQLYFLSPKYTEAIKYNYYMVNIDEDDIYDNEEGCIYIGIININFDYITGEKRWVLSIRVEDTLKEKRDKEIQIDLKYIDEETLKAILSDYKVVTETQWQGIWRQKQIDSVINDD